jgi:hypothetical protein
LVVSSDRPRDRDAVEILYWVVRLLDDEHILVKTWGRPI